MSTDDVDNFSDDSEGIKQLREHAKANAKALKEAQDRLAAFEARERENTVKEALKAKGLPEKVAQFYNGDASEDAVSKWLEENADVFGVKPADSSGGEPDANALAAQRIAAASGGQPATAPALGATGNVYGDPRELLAKVNGNQRLPYQTLVDLGIMPDPKFDPNRRPIDRD